MTTQFSLYHLPVPVYLTFVVSTFIYIEVLSLPVFPYNNVPLHNYTFLHTKLDQNTDLKPVPNHPEIHFKTQGTLYDIQDLHSILLGLSHHALSQLLMNTVVKAYTSIFMTECSSKTMATT